MKSPLALVIDKSFLNKCGLPKTTKILYVDCLCCPRPFANTLTANQPFRGNRTVTDRLPFGSCKLGAVIVSSMLLSFLLSFPLKTCRNDNSGVTPDQEGERLPISLMAPFQVELEHFIEQRFDFFAAFCKHHFNVIADGCA